MSWFDKLKGDLKTAFDCRTPKPGIGGSGAMPAPAPPPPKLEFPEPPDDVQWCQFMSRRKTISWAASYSGGPVQTVMVFSLKHRMDGNKALAVGGIYVDGGMYVDPAVPMLDRVGPPVVLRNYRTLETAAAYGSPSWARAQLKQMLADEE